MTEARTLTSQVRRIPATPWFDADEGLAVKVRVSFTDDAGNEEAFTSAATATVAARPNKP